MTPSQAVAQERARLREEVVKLRRYSVVTTAITKGEIQKSYTIAQADVLALLN